MYINKIHSNLIIYSPIGNVLFVTEYLRKVNRILQTNFCEYFITLDEAWNIWIQFVVAGNSWCFISIGKEYAMFIFFFYLQISFQGRPRGEGEASPPTETGKIVVEKWCYFPELYKMTKVREDGIENG